MPDPREELRKALEGSRSSVRGQLPSSGLPARVDPRTALRKATSAVQSDSIGRGGYGAFRPVESYFLFDTANFMIIWSSEICENIKEIGKELLSEDKVGIFIWEMQGQFYEESQQGGSHFMVKKHPFTTDMDELKAQLRSIDFRGGASDCYQHAWRELTQELSERKKMYGERVVVVNQICGSYPRGIIPVYDGIPKKSSWCTPCPDGLDAVETLDELLGNIHSFNMIHCQEPELGYQPHPYPGILELGQQQFLESVSKLNGRDNWRYMLLKDGMKDLISPLLIAATKKAEGVESVRAYLEHKGGRIETDVRKLLGLGSGYEVVRRQ